MPTLTEQAVRFDPNVPPQKAEKTRAGDMKGSAPKEMPPTTSLSSAGGPSLRKKRSDTTVDPPPQKPGSSHPTVQLNDSSSNI